MRLIHPTHPYTVLLFATLLAPPLAAQIPGGLRPAPRAQAPGNGTTVVIWARHLQTLQARLDSFAVALPAEERALWEGVLLRAAHAPTPAASEVRVTPVLEIGPGGGCEDSPGMNEAASRVAIIVQGGRTADVSGIIVQGGRTATPATGIIVQGGRTATPADGIIVQGGRTATPADGIIAQGGRTPAGQGADAPRRNPAGDGVVAIGPKQDDPGAPRPGGVEAIGPKQDDPAPGPGRVSAVTIGPKQDDPAPPPQSLGRRLADFSLQLSAEERGALDWLLTRAASAPEGRPGTPGGLASTPDPEGRPGRPGTVPAGAMPGGRPGTPGGLPPGVHVSLRQALGIDPLAIGPKQDDPTPPPPAQRWILRF